MNKSSLNHSMLPETSTVEGIHSRHVNTLISKLVSDSSPGCVVAVIQNGQVVHLKGYGLANIAYDIPNSPETVFYVASLAKQFTAMCIAILIEQGKLSEKEDIRKYVPELPDYGHTMTIGHLIHHMSGLREYIHLYLSKGYKLNHEFDKITVEDVLDLVFKQKNLDFSPGEQHAYTNTGYLLLGVIIERITGKKLHEFAKEQIFEPLGMDHTFFCYDATMIVKNSAVGYKPTKDGGYVLDTTRSGITGGSGLITNVLDLVKWDQNFYENKLGAGTDNLIEILQRTGKLNDGTDTNYAFGLRIGEHKKLPLITHSGSFASFYSVYHRFPKQQLSVICLSNLGSFDAVKTGLTIAELYLKDHVDNKEPSIQILKSDLPNLNYIRISEQELSQYEGLYRSLRTQFILKVDQQQGTLLLSSYAENETPNIYKPVSSTKFGLVQRSSSEINSAPILEFSIDKDTNVIHLANIYPNNFRSVYRKFPAANSTSQELEEYQGAYFSHELDVLYWIFVKKNQLLLKIQNSAKEQILHPADQDEFIVNLDAIKFVRDENAHIKGLKIINASHRLSVESRAGWSFEKLR